MIYYPISAFVNAATSIILGLFVITRNSRSTLNRSFAYFSFSVALWSISYFFWQISNNESNALLWCHVLMAFAVYIPSTFFHFAVSLIGKYNKYYRKANIFYTISTLFFISNFTSLLVKDVKPQLIFSFWPSAGAMYAPYLVMFAGATIYAHVLMFKHYRSLSGLKRNQVKYVVLGTAVGFLGGSTNYPLWFGIPILPIGNIFVSVYVFLLAYSIIRYQLMDIKIAMTRAGIFVCVYTLILGIPFYCAYNLGLWKQSLWLMMILATTGPFIYLFLQKKAEEQLLIEQRQYQTTLQQASLGMGQIKNLKRLLDLIVHIVTRAVRIEHCEIYLLHEDSGQFTLKASRGWLLMKEKQVSVIISNSPIINYLKENKESIVYDEIERQVRDGNDIEIRSIEAILRKLNGSLIVPNNRIC